MEPRRRSTPSPRSRLFTARQRRGSLARSLSPVPLSPLRFCPHSLLFPPLISSVSLRSYALRYELSFFSSFFLSLPRFPFAPSSSIRSVFLSRPFHPYLSIPRILSLDFSRSLFFSLWSSISVLIVSMRTRPLDLSLSTWTSERKREDRR